MRCATACGPPVSTSLSISTSANALMAALPSGWTRTRPGSCCGFLTALARLYCSELARRFVFTPRTTAVPIASQKIACALAGEPGTLTTSRMRRLVASCYTLVVHPAPRPRDAIAVDGACGFLPPCRIVRFGSATSAQLNQCIH